MCRQRGEGRDAALAQSQLGFGLVEPLGELASHLFELVIESPGLDQLGEGSRHGLLGGGRDELAVCLHQGQQQLGVEAGDAAPVQDHLLLGQQVRRLLQQKIVQIERHGCLAKHEVGLVQWHSDAAAGVELLLGEVIGSNRDVDVAGPAGGGQQCQHQQGGGGFEHGISLAKW